MRNLKIVLDEWVYEVEFDANGYEYDYDIDAVTGEILKNEKQADSNWLNNPQAQPGQGGQNNQASQGNYIGQEKAKQIALEHAGVAQDSLRKLEIDLDREHGVMVYEVEFDANGYEYSYDINASTGQVLKYEKEYDD